MRFLARAVLFRSFIVAIVLASIGSLAAGTSALAAKRAKASKPTKFGRPTEELEAAKGIDGRELFERQWVPDDERSHGGDGLGPMFNEKSCVACHKDGGVGGSGPRANNSMIMSPAITVSSKGRITSSPFTLFELAMVHPGFLTSPSVVLHRFGTSDEYAKWFKDRQGSKTRSRGGGLDRNRFPVPMAVAIEAIRSKAETVPVSRTLGRVEIVVTERNTTSLFGVGAIEEVSDRDILTAANVQFPAWPEVSGRAVVFENGSIGRFGWKAQQPTLRDFVSTACAVELGLQVPDFHQSMNPLDPMDQTTHELDLNNNEVTALTMFIANLDKPIIRSDLTDEEKKTTEIGLETFNAVGCAACHRPQIGSLKGAFTDLLVHDMGQVLADTGAYYATRVIQIGTPVQTGRPQQKGKRKGQKGAEQQARQQQAMTPADTNEWRTPPLWGLRDSAPYMHDGRAETVEEAIAWHGGEAERSMAAYFLLAPERRAALLAFMDTLVAPKPKAAPSKDDAEEAAGMLVREGRATLSVDDGTTDK